MTVDPKWLMEKASRGVVDLDRRCVCGYSLRGLKIGGKCPECGRRIPDAARLRSTSTHKLIEYPDGVLVRLALGTTLASLGMGMVTLTYLALWLQRGINVGDLYDMPISVPVVMLLVGVLPGACLWVSGLLFLSAADPGASPSEPSPGNLLAGRPAWWRLLIVGSQSLWPLGAASAITGLMFEDAKPDLALGLMLGSVGAAVLASLALSPICLMLKELAYHAQDDFSWNRFHGLAFGIPFAGAVFALLPALPFLFNLSRTGTFIGLLGLSILLSPAAYLFLRALMSLAHTCRWARNNAQGAAEREQRFIARSRGEQV